MVVFAAGSVLYTTSNVLHQYKPINMLLQLSLFALSCTSFLLHPSGFDEPE
jgi:hypothetical protein